MKRITNNIYNKKIIRIKADENNKCLLKIT